MENNLFSNYFLGVRPLDQRDPEFEEYQKLNPSSLAMMFITFYGGIDGAHHKNWVLDQVSRILMDTPVLFEVAEWKNGMREVRFCTGEPSSSYLNWVDEIQGETYDDGTRQYFYDYGIAP